VRRFSRVVGLALVASLVVVASAGADVADEQALAERYAPVVRLVEQLEECGPGEPYEPIDVNLVFDEPTVALRGPWNSVDLVKIAPTATDVAGLLEYHLDFPGNPLDAGCSYELWARQLTTGTQPAIYAHVATEPGRDRALALQYWFFYPCWSYWRWPGRRGRRAVNRHRPRSCSRESRECAIRYE
jgi:hypothetical protein